MIVIMFSIVIIVMLVVVWYWWWLFDDDFDCNGNACKRRLQDRSTSSFSYWVLYYSHLLICLIYYHSYSQVVYFISLPLIYLCFCLSLIEKKYIILSISFTINNFTYIHVVIWTASEFSLKILVILTKWNYTHSFESFTRSR